MQTPTAERIGTELRGGKGGKGARGRGGALTI